MAEGVAPAAAGPKCRGGKGVGGADSGKVRARRGHGRKKTSLTWGVLESIDKDVTAVAMLMAKQYGYNMSL